MYLDLLKITIPTIIAFFIGILITPSFSNFFYKNKMWKKKPRSEDVQSYTFKEIHKQKKEKEISTPCVGGSIIWSSVLITVFLVYVISLIFPGEVLNKFNFLSRSQTLLPLGVFVFGALLGLIDDLLEISGRSDITRSKKWYTKLKIFTIILISFLVGLWFYTKLGMDSVHIPFGDFWYLGIFIIPFFILVALSTFSGGVIDGIDGLSGGVLISIFSAFTVIAYTNNQIDLATLSAVITGALLAFLWFNIPPARFYMGETGMMPLTLIIAVFAFFTDSVLILPIIAFPLVVTSLSVILQMSFRKWGNGKKLFRVAPLHHHFEAIGWPTYKVTMRYWVLSIIFSIIGIIIFVISR
jgi:phospho-N-acetylmuramoyl-pentapeptide-transferase